MESSDYLGHVTSTLHLMFNWLSCFNGECLKMLMDGLHLKFAVTRTLHLMFNWLRGSENVEGQAVLKICSPKRKQC